MSIAIQNYSQPLPHPFEICVQAIQGDTVSREILINLKNQIILQLFSAVCTYTKTERVERCKQALHLITDIPIDYMHETSPSTKTKIMLELCHILDRLNDQDVCDILREANSSKHIFLQDYVKKQHAYPIISNEEKQSKETYKLEKTADCYTIDAMCKYVIHNNNTEIAQTLKEWLLKKWFMYDSSTILQRLAFVALSSPINIRRKKCEYALKLIENMDENGSIYLQAHIISGLTTIIYGLGDQRFWNIAVHKLSISKQEFIRNHFSMCKIIYINKEMIRQERLNFTKLNQQIKILCCLAIQGDMSVKVALQEWIYCIPNILDCLVFIVRTSLGKMREANCIRAIHLLQDIINSSSAHPRSVEIALTEMLNCFNDRDCWNIRFTLFANDHFFIKMYMRDWFLHAIEIAPLEKIDYFMQIWESKKEDLQLHEIAQEMCSLLEEQQKERKMMKRVGAEHEHYLPYNQFVITCNQALTGHADAIKNLNKYVNDNSTILEMLVFVAINSSVEKCAYAIHLLQDMADDLSKSLSLKIMIARTLEKILDYLNDQECWDIQFEFFASDHLFIKSYMKDWFLHTIEVAPLEKIDYFMQIWEQKKEDPQLHEIAQEMCAQLEEKKLQKEQEKVNLRCLTSKHQFVILCNWALIDINASNALKKLFLVNPLVLMSSLVFVAISSPIQTQRLEHALELMNTIFKYCPKHLIWVVKRGVHSILCKMQESLSVQ